MTIARQTICFSMGGNEAVAVEGVIIVPAAVAVGGVIIVPAAVARVTLVERPLLTAMMVLVMEIAVMETTTVVLVVESWLEIADDCRLSVRV